MQLARACIRLQIYMQPTTLWHCFKRIGKQTIKHLREQHSLADHWWRCRRRELNQNLRVADLWLKGVQGSKDCF
jgi:hypothetical protein